MSTPEINRIVAVHGAPRSGTSWLGQLFNSSEHVAYRYQPMFSYAFKNRLTTHSSPSDVKRFFSDLLATQDDFVLQRGSASLTEYELSFPKQQITHLVYKEVRYHDLLENLLESEPRMAAIGLVRNPCAVIHSWSRARREFESEWDLLSEWHTAPKKNYGKPENWYGFERWKELVTLFHRLRDRFPGRFQIVCYETLVVKPEQTLRDLFRASDLPWTMQTAHFLRETCSRNDGQVYGVFRDGRAERSDWREELDPTIIEMIHEYLRGTPFSRYLSPASVD